LVWPMIREIAATPSHLLLLMSPSSVISPSPPIGTGYLDLIKMEARRPVFAAIGPFPKLVDLFRVKVEWREERRGRVRWLHEQVVQWVESLYSTGPIWEMLDHAYQGRP